MGDSAESARENLGNSRNQIHAAKHWAFTLNNYTHEDIESIKALDSAKVPIITFQEEVGESGTPHLQGSLTFALKGRPFGLGLSNRIHWEKKRGTVTELRNYTVKDESRVEGGIRYMRGWEPAVKYVEVIHEMREWQKTILRILDGQRCDRTIYWYWEGTGGVGKTKFCKYVFTHYEDVIVLGGKAADMKHAVVQFKEKNERLPKIILVDIPRSTMEGGHISYQGIEEVKNMFFFSGKYEGGQVCGEPPHMVIFANEEPVYSKLSSDRWSVHEITMGQQSRICFDAAS